MSQDVFTIVTLYAVLVVTREEFVDTSRLIEDHFVHVIMELENLTSQKVDLHHNCIRNFGCFFLSKGFLAFQA
jgi:hypothetical protein